MLDEKFNVGDRVCFQTKCGAVVFGTVQRTDHGKTHLLICGDDNQLYRGWGTEVMKLEKNNG